jgi:hypothetical protein
MINETYWVHAVLANQWIEPLLVTEELTHTCVKYLAAEANGSYCSFRRDK